MADALSPGVIVAETFEVERLLGRGGMGEVWLARHRRLAGKHVAIKVLHTQGALPAEALARFRREGEIAARLEHPNIVQVLDFNSLPSGEPFIVMEYLKGESLAARLKRGPMSPDETSQVMRQVGSALHAAHLASVVHRDLKPENIFLVPTGLGDQVKVLDFGISKLSDGGTMQTTDSVLMGTPLYMSPEQALGHNSEVTGQSDVFSLGSIAYECLTGKAPFEADNIAKVVFRIAYEPHVPLMTHAPHVPEAMARAVEHALEKELAKRSPSVAAFVLELTGQVLANTGSHPALVPQREAGVLKPGAQVDEQMMADATMAPKSLVKDLATPNPNAASAKRSSAGAHAAASPQPSPQLSPSRAGLVVGALVVAALGGGAFVFLSGPSTTQPTAVDAGLLVVAPLPPVDSGSVEVDAGVAVANVAPDASAPSVVAVDGASDAEDAGAAVVRIKPVATLKPPPPAEAQVLKQIEADLNAGKVDEVWRKEPGLRQRFSSKEGLRDFLVLTIEAACRRSDLGSAASRMRQLEPEAAREHARRRCAKYSSFEL